MEKPKYQIGDRVGETNLIVCGYLRLSNGSYRYYLQIESTDNTLVMSEGDIEAIEKSA